MHITNPYSNLTPGDGILNCVKDSARLGVLVNKKAKGIKNDWRKSGAGIQQRSIALHDVYTPAYQCV